MALVECKECSKEVSEAAISCPYCGISAPGVADEKIEASVKRMGFLQQRWIAGIAFWPGLLILTLPMFAGEGKEAVASAWELSKWLMGFGLGWYVLSEIERNLYEKKLAKDLK